MCSAAASHQSPATEPLLLLLESPVPPAGCAAGGALDRCWPALLPVALAVAEASPFAVLLLLLPLLWLLLPPSSLAVPLPPVLLLLPEPLIWRASARPESKSVN